MHSFRSVAERVPGEFDGTPTMVLALSGAAGVPSGELRLYSNPAHLVIRISGDTAIRDSPANEEKPVHATAIGNLKGGVGKTTVTLNLAIAIILRLRARFPNARLLLWDMDPQSSLTALLTGRDPRDFTRTVATLLAGLSNLDETLIHLDEATWLDETTQGALVGIDLIPSNPVSLLRADTADALWELRELIPELDLPDTVEMLFDCGYGDTDAFTMSAIAADDVVAVTSASEMGLMGLQNLQIKLRKMAARSFTHVRLSGVIANMFDLREIAHRAILDNLREELADLLWEPVIPRRSIVEKSHGARLPLAGMTGAGVSREVLDDILNRFDQLGQRLITLEGTAA